nr:hypothetical protein [Tanacetum cinerariifolium]
EDQEGNNSSEIETLPLFHIHGGSQHDFFGVKASDLSSDHSVGSYYTARMVGPHTDITKNFPWNVTPRTSRERAESQERAKGENEPSRQPKLYAFIYETNHSKSGLRLPSLVALVIVIDKSWTSLGKHEKIFYTGLKKFVDDCKPLVDSAGNIRCPSCLNDLSYIPLNNEQNESTQGDIGKTSNDLTQAKRNEFEELYASVNEKLYTGCDYVTRLDFMESLPILRLKSIHACVSDCFLFWGEANKDVHFNSVCNTSRWKDSNTPGKKVPKKVLHYFLIIHKLQRLYKSSHTAKEMTWHATEKCTEPVIQTTYNLPPWLCMKESSFMLTLLIPGPKSPNKDIDVYLRPLIDDLKDLWAKPGVETIYVATSLKFNMRVMVLWTINDFLARSSLSGWSGQGYRACPTCNEDIPSVRVLGKTAYVGHKRFLKKPHKWRRSLEFNGETEDEDPPREFSRDAIMTQLARLPTRVKEAIFDGRIRPRWTYPFERYMKNLKNYVRNKAKQEGSIAKGYVAEEALTSSSHYFRDVTTKFNRPDRIVDCPPPTFMKSTRTGPSSRGSEFPNKDMKEEFPGWFGKQIRQRHADNDPGVSESNELLALAYGPSQTPISVNSCVVNDARFVVHNHDERRTTQNNGICSSGPDGEMYYGQLEQILEFSYLLFKTVLFRVKWFDTSNKGCIHNFIIRNNITQIKANGEAFKNDQYIFATQVKQYFYLEDMARGPPGWKVVEHVCHKKFSNRGVIVVEDDSNVIHVDNSYDLALYTSLNDLEIAALHKDGQSIDVDAPSNVSRCCTGHGGDGGSDDRPPSYQIPTGYGGCLGKSTQKPNFGGRRAGMMHTRQETRNLRLKAITDKNGPILIRFEFGDRETLMPFGDHAAHWANYLRELNLFDLRPHMDFDHWPQIYAGIQQHLQKIYNGKKTAFKERYSVPDEDGTYDVERIRRGRPLHIFKVDWDAHITFWNDHKNLARAA